MNVIIIEILILIVLFTLVIFILSKEPIKTLYNYPPKIQERVKSLDEYKDKIPTNKNKIFAKITASFIMILVISIIMKYINGYNEFFIAFKNSYIIWTVINLYDLIVLDCIWFCHDKRFVFKGTEDMIKDYHDYIFHAKGFCIGQVLGLIICLIVGFVVTIL